MAVDSHFPAGHLQFDLSGDEHGGNEIAKRVLRPAERRIREMIYHPLAIDRTMSIDVIMDADHSLVVGLDVWGSAADLDEAQWIDGRVHCV